MESRSGRHSPKRDASKGKDLLNTKATSLLFQVRIQARMLDQVHSILITATQQQAL